MNYTAVKTRPLVPPKDDLFAVLNESIQVLPEKSVVAVTSKVVAIHQGRCVAYESKEQRDELAKTEAEWWLSRKIAPGRHVMYTIINGALVASAGIDASNADDYYVLLPQNAEAFAQELQGWFKQRFGISEVGVVITDSHMVPMRRGVLGYAVAYFGFNPLRDYRGQKDIFGRELKVTLSNIPDALAAGAVLSMGEGSEQQPVVVITEAKGIEFSDEVEVNRGVVPMRLAKEEDLFAPMINAVPWRRGGDRR
jgi:dihydrofolate synthase / folylpolyglutamate synthase